MSVMVTVDENGAPSVYVCVYWACVYIGQSDWGCDEAGLQSMCGEGESDEEVGVCVCACMLGWAILQ